MIRNGSKAPPFLHNSWGLRAFCQARIDIIRTILPAKIPGPLVRWPGVV